MESIILNMDNIRDQLGLSHEELLNQYGLHFSDFPNINFNQNMTIEEVDRLYQELSEKAQAKEEKIPNQAEKNLRRSTRIAALNIRLAKEKAEKAAIEKLNQQKEQEEKDEERRKDKETQKNKKKKKEKQSRSRSISKSPLRQPMNQWAEKALFLKRLNHLKTSNEPDAIAFRAKSQEIVDHFKRTNPQYYTQEKNSRLEIDEFIKDIPDDIIIDEFIKDIPDDIIIDENDFLTDQEIDDAVDAYEKELTLILNKKANQAPQVPQVPQAPQAPQAPQTLSQLEPPILRRQSYSFSSISSDESSDGFQVILHDLDDWKREDIQKYRLSLKTLQNISKKISRPQDRRKMSQHRTWTLHNITSKLGDGISLKKLIKKPIQKKNKKHTHEQKKNPTQKKKKKQKHKGGKKSRKLIKK